MVERDAEQRPRVVQRCRASLAVAPDEGCLPAAEMRDHERDRDERPDDARGRDRQTLAPSAAGERVPDAEPGDHERHVLAADRGHEGEHRERNEPVLVEVPEREQQRRRRERTGMELVQREPRRRRVDEVHQREAEARAARADVLARQPVHRQRTEREGGRLRDEQQVRARPEPPERREQHEHRIEVRTEPQYLLPAEVRDTQRMPVRREPDGLDHVSEVEASRLERPVAQHRQGAEAGGERPRSEPER